MKIEPKSLADQYAEKGINLANSGDLDNAIKFFKKSIKLSPNAQIYYFLGLSHQLKGDLENAKKYYLKSIKTDDKYSMSYNNLGVIYLDQKEYSKAVNCFEKSIKSDISNSFAYNNLGNAYKKMGDSKKAKQAWKNAIKIFPRLPEPYNNLGVLAYEEKKYKKAISYLKKAADIDPEYIQPLYHLGFVFARLKKFNIASNYLEKYIKKAKPDANTLALLANCYLNCGKLKEALEKFEEALTLEPESPFIINDLGNLYKQIGDLEKAAYYYQKALKINPKLDGTLNNLGTVFFNRRQYQKAINTFTKAIEINPNISTAHYHLGLIFERQGKFDKAARHLVKAYQIDPELGEALNVITYLTMQGCLYDKYDYYSKKLDELTIKEIKKGGKISQSPFLNTVRTEDPKTHLQIASQKSREIKEDVKGYLENWKTPKFKRKGVITLGYLSNDFYDHATTHLIQRLFKLHNRNRFAVYAYSYGPDDKSPYRKMLEKDADLFVDIKDLSFIDAARKIRQDGVDILIDLKGHTRDSRLEILALRPSPIQIHYLGYPGTTGADFIDYFLTDSVITRKEDEKYFSEKLIYLPNSYQINNNQRQIWKGEITKEEMGIPKNKFVFCSFNQSYKINRRTLYLWLEILKKAKESVLVLLETNSFAPREIKKEAEKNGVNPKRIIFVPRLPQEKHLARIGLCDLALDTLTCNGHTTTSDTLWAGVPVVALYGKHFASRVSSSLLSAINLKELITHSGKEYLELAVDLYKNPKKLEKIKKKLEKNRLKAPLFDSEQTVKNLEKAFLEAVERKFGKVSS
ncbi:MAG: hypothetical protein KatS3mg088_774 [Patescibacteria group bacterium]|nr:MAG: hypothetical protein KatS3mg088_774 [Patescibacteria group bacterium]